MSRSLKIWFGVHALVSLVFGIGLFIIPARVGAWVAWPTMDVLMARMYGASLLALCAASALAYSAKTWDEVHVTVAMEAVFCVLSAVIDLYGLLLENAPIFQWFVLALMVVFAAAWIYYLAQPHAAPHSTPPSLTTVGKPAA